MPEIYGLLRVKNEERWIGRVLQSIAGCCKSVVVLDDHSSDRTAEIARDAGAHVIPSPFEGLDEARDKDYLVQEAHRICGPFSGPGQWALLIDGDEELAAGDAKYILAAAECGIEYAWSLRILYLWDSERTVRTDGVYGRFRRPSLFPLRVPLDSFSHGRTGRGGFHCGSVPQTFFGRSLQCDARLLHYGYIDRAMRLAKWDWYNTIDPHDTAEDQYRHMIQGDTDRRQCPYCAEHGLEHFVSIPNEPLKHAGPLRLEAFDEANPKAH
jgi:glycosyltransferase involved in cell wall biosynthesis